MKKLKIVTVVGTRPEIIRLACILKKLDEHCEHILIHTNQNYDYELNKIFFDDLEIRKPDYFLGTAGTNGAETIGNVIIEVDKALEEIKPEAMLVLGDTNSCMALLAAKRRKIPTFHMEAGNRCFDQRVPEEINRRLVDHMADVNLTYSSIAREYLLREGLPADLIIKTGSPIFEVLNTYRDGINSSDVMSRLEIKKNEFFVVSVHREENIDSDKNFLNLVDSLNAIAEIYQIPIIVSTHPRTQKRFDEIKVELNPMIQLLKPIGFKDFNKLQISAKAVLSDSGTINEESSILNFPALNLREAHERPEGMEEAAVIMTGTHKERIIQSLAIINSQPRGKKRLVRQVSDYSMPNVSDKIVRIIHSYTDYVNRVIWKKY
jgi:UDP-N-acetylglucosamine 2-epimerase (non-hydrolysing)